MAAVIPCIKKKRQCQGKKRSLTKQLIICGRPFLMSSDEYMNIIYLNCGMNVKKTIAGIDATFAVAKKKSLKKFGPEFFHYFFNTFFCVDPEKSACLLVKFHGLNRNLESGFYIIRF